MKKILVTGGAGFIGSHICLKLLEKGYTPVVFDNLTNGHPDAVPDEAIFIQGDIRKKKALDSVFAAHSPLAVIHLAGLIEAGQSMSSPGLFYDVNVTGSQVLFTSMQQYDCKKIVFSSTAAVYGNSEKYLIDESEPVCPTNPYGRSKAIVETILADYCKIHGFRALALRYFNAAGADPAGRAGERHEPETHLIPLCLMAAKNNGRAMSVFGTDYPTPDGTCVRDYVHVDDLADAHIAALQYAMKATDPAFEQINIGREEGSSVLEVLKLCEKITNCRLKINFKERRAGDPYRLVSRNGKAKDLLGWEPKFTDLEDIIAHAWKFMEQADK